VFKSWRFEKHTSESYHLYIIWHYCIISHIKLWFLKMTSSHKYVLKNRQWSKVFGHFRFAVYISYKTSFLIYYLEVISWPISIIILSTKQKEHFEALFSNRHDLNTDLNNLSAKVLLLHFVSKNNFRPLSVI
jgi:hypothetical protein